LTAYNLNIGYACNGYSRVGVGPHDAFYMFVTFENTR